MWGATIDIVRSPKIRRYFNPRAPCGARQAFVSTGAQDLKISIHAPRVGRDVQQALTAFCRYHISIHAPRVGRDWEAHCGQRTGAGISIHAPRVGRDSSNPITTETQKISIHAPRVGRDARPPCPPYPAGPYFNPRAPCGARPGFPDHAKTVKGISIHAPRVGRDMVRRGETAAPAHFNPRAPCGARPRMHRQLSLPSIFQSTRPVWGATMFGIASIMPAAIISIHAPRVGRDRGDTSPA